MTRTWILVALVALGTVALIGIVAAAAPDEYEGRTIAGVMGWQGAPWLERDGRAREENTPLLMERLAVKPGQVVLDLGCGTGFHTRRLSAAVGPKGEVYCVDLQPQMLELAKARAEAAGLTNIRFVEGKPHAVPAPKGAIDLLIMVDVYHELEDPKAMLAEMHRVLKPDGRVALVEFRLEGHTAAHIKVDHRMSVDQVRKEWLPAGFALQERFDGLPTQHLFLFTKTQPASHE